MSMRKLKKLGGERKQLVARLWTIDSQLPDLLIEEWGNGHSLAELGEIVGHSKQRIHQIINKEVR